LIAESVNRVGGELSGEDPTTVRAEPSLLGATVGVVRLVVDGEEFLVLVRSAAAPDATVSSAHEEV
jgi:hypothetical protein